MEKKQMLSGKRSFKQMPSEQKAYNRIFSEETKKRDKKIIHRSRVINLKEDCQL